MTSELPEPLPSVAQDALDFDQKLEEIRYLFRERNNVYQGQFHKQGISAVLAWLRVKQQRIAHQLQNPDTHGDDEGLAENFLDVAVYGLLGAMLAEEPTRPASCAHLYAEDPEQGGLCCVICGHRPT